MAERKLNFNAPLLSVRRFASRPMSPNRENLRIAQSSPPTRRRQTVDPPPPPEPDFSLEQVTEPVAVPFYWEKIPGRAKDGQETKPQPQEKASVTWKIHLGQACKATKQPLDRDYGHKTDIKPQSKTYSSSSNVVKSKHVKVGTNGRGRAGLDNEDDDVYSDALDTLSSIESVSLNCSASGLSGSSGAGLVQPSGSFSTDPQTRDFMMKRFLPAAKAMALEPPRNYATKKQTVSVQEQPREIKRVVGEEKRPFNEMIGSNLIVPQHGDNQEQAEEEESEEEVEEYNEPKIVSTSGCGLFPRLCFRNSLSLLGPVSGLKVSSPKLTKSAYNQSLSKSVKKAWDNYKKKSDSRYCSAELKVAENKRADQSRRFTFSGELKGRLSPFRTSRAADTDLAQKQKKPDIRSRSGELRVVENNGWAGEPRRFAYSGELHRGRLSPFRNTRMVDLDSISKNKKSDIRPQSAELKVIDNERVGESRQLAYSGDLQRLMSSPFRNSRASSISPYRNQSNQSPFRRGAFLGVPKEVNVQASVSNYRPNVKEASTYQGSFPVSPAVEKTLYVDTVNNANTSDLTFNYLGNKAQVNSGSKDFEHSSEPSRVEESSAEFSFQDIKCPNNGLEQEILEHGISVSFENKRSSLFIAGLEQELKSLDRSEISTATTNISKEADQKEDSLDVNSSLVQSPAPPPLPRSPSESWLWRTIPSISLRNSFGSKAQAKNLDSKTSSMSSTKWETIVKTTKFHHDHARYSEELVAHISKQSKT